VGIGIICLLAGLFQTVDCRSRSAEQLASWGGGIARMIWGE
jgi:hypothetical protein